MANFSDSVSGGAHDLLVLLRQFKQAFSRPIKMGRSCSTYFIETVAKDHDLIFGHKHVMTTCASQCGQLFSLEHVH